MKKNQLVCIAFPKWEGDYLKSTVQLMKYLASEYDILYVDYPYTWSDVIKSWFGTRQFPVKKILGIEKRMESVKTINDAKVNLLRLPPIIPMNWAKSHFVYNLIARINSKLLLPYVRKAMKQLGFENPAVFNAFQPWLGHLWKGKLDESQTIYYCYDEMSAAPWISKHGPLMEKKFITEADQVIVTSSALRQIKSQLNPRVSIVKNGVDEAIFGVPSRQSKRSHPLMKNQKVVGYIGSIDDRLDTELLNQLISSLADHRFQFVGRIVCSNTAKELSRHANVTLPGPMDPSQLPHQLDEMDVCIIPFKTNKLTAAIYPLKINEYLFRGKPVVTTRFADLSDFEEIVSVATNTNTFITQVQYQLSSKDQSQIQKRKEFAKSNTWKERAASLQEILDRA